MPGNRTAAVHFALHWPPTDTVIASNKVELPSCLRYLPTVAQETPSFDVLPTWDFLPVQM